MRIVQSANCEHPLDRARRLARPGWHDLENELAARVREARELTTGEAIEAVLASVPGGAEVLYCGYQLLVRKRRGERDASDDVTPVRLH